MPSVSIIVPVYKAEKYLHACVDSILRQSFQDFEIYLVDDGSPDGSGAICDDYANKDSRIHVIHQENRGQAAARNRALEVSQGQWICFVDSDDLIHPRMLELLWDAAKAADAQIGMCMMTQAPELPADFYREPDDSREVLAMDEATLVSLYDRDEYPGWVACAKLIRRELVESYPFGEGRVYEDNEAVCHWICAAERLVRLADPMYFYRTNPISTTQNRFSEKRLDYLWALERIIRFYGSIGYAAMRQRFADRYAYALADCMDGARYHLERMDLVRKIRKQGRNFRKQEGISLTLPQKERLLNAVHPTLIKAYWPAKGVVMTLRAGGISAVIRKLRDMRKEDGQ